MFSVRKNQKKGLSLLALAGALTLSILAPMAAEASHFRGAAMIPTVDSNGLLTVNSTSFWRPTAVANVGNPSIGGVGTMTQIAGPTFDTTDSRFTRVSQTHTRQLSGAGTYTITAGSCCRVSGIQNASASSWSMTSVIFWDGSTANNPIAFNFNSVQIEVSRPSGYSDNLGAVAGNGGTLTYNQALNTGISSQPPGFVIDPNTGQLTVPQASAATWNDNPTGNIGADYAFSGNIMNSDGSSVEFDWLFDAVDATASNLAPDVDDFVLNLTPGDLGSHTFTGSDPDGDTLTWDFQGLLGPTGGLAAPTFDPTTQQFTWDTTGTVVGQQFIAQARASDGLLTDTGNLTINIVQGQSGGPTGGGPNPNPVPEPSTVLLLGSGLFGLAAWRKFRKPLGE